MLLDNLKPGQSDEAFVMRFVIALCILLKVDHDKLTKLALDDAKLTEYMVNLGASATTALLEKLKEDVEQSRKRKTRK